MSLLKRISGTLLTAVGVIVILGAIVCLLDKEPFDSALVLTFFLFGVLPFATGMLLLRKNPAEATPKHCPKCGGHEHAQAGVLATNAGLMLLLIPLGAWLIGCLWGGSRPQQVRCVQCDTLYLIDTRASRITGIALWTLLLLLLLGFIAMFFDIH